jgi:hypothetical protein
MATTLFRARGTRPPGLGEAWLIVSSVPPSNLSLLALVRHMACVERDWFRIWLAGEDAPRLYRREGRRTPTSTTRSPIGRWRPTRSRCGKDEIAFAERFVASPPDLA